MGTPDDPLANALYGNGIFINEIEKIWPGVQVITQIRANQKIKFRNKDIVCKKYFESYQGWSHAVSIRGQKAVNAFFFTFGNNSLLKTNSL